MNAIEFKNVSLGFGDKEILQNFTATISHGEFVGIFGPNGAGKTVLLRTVLGLLKPLKGSIYVYGNSPQQERASIGYMPQMRRDLDAFPISGRAYLATTLTGTGWGMPFLNRQQRDEIDQVIELVGMPYIDRPLRQFSGGERQLLALAQTLLGHPKILLLDEPLSNLDPGQQEKIVSLIHTIQQRLSITVLLTAHNINPLLHVMNHIVYLAHGKAAIGSLEEVVNSKTLSWLYDTPVEVLHSGPNVWVMPKTLEREGHDEDHSHVK